MELCNNRTRDCTGFSAQAGLVKRFYGIINNEIENENSKTCKYLQPALFTAAEAAQCCWKTLKS